MAYDQSIPAGGPANFVTPNLAHEGEGVRVDFITVDYISDVSAEVTHSTAAANTAGLKLSMDAIQNQGVNILGMGALGNSNNGTNLHGKSRRSRHYKFNYYSSGNPSGNQSLERINSR